MQFVDPQLARQVCGGLVDVDLDLTTSDIHRALEALQISGEVIGADRPGLPPAMHVAARGPHGSVV